MRKMNRMLARSERKFGRRLYSGRRKFGRRPVNKKRGITIILERMISVHELILFVTASVLWY